MSNKGQSLIESATMLITAHQKLESNYLAADSVRVSSRFAVQTLGELATYQIMAPYMGRIAACLSALALAGFCRKSKRELWIRTALHNMLLLRDVVIDDAVSSLDGNAGLLMRMVLERQASQP